MMPQTPESSLLELREGQFRQLTQRASLAVVARTARRILPLLVQQEGEIAYYWPAEGATRLAETLAGGGLVTVHDAQEAQKALRLDSEGLLWREWSSRRTPFHVRACVEHLALAARFVACALNDDCECSPTDQGEEVARRVPRAVAVAALEALEAVQSLQPQVDTADTLLDQERELLSTHSPLGYRDLGPPIDPGPGGPLGPLWPAGTPLWYRPPPYPGRVVKRFPPEAAPQPPTALDPGLFVASAEAANLALHCRDRSGRQTVPDLRVTSRRVVQHGKEAERLDVAREAIGERLVRLVSGLGTETALGDKPPSRVLVLRDPHHFSEEVEQRLTERLGLSPSADALADFRSTLAEEFHRWLREHPDRRERKRGEFEGEQFFVRCPVLRRRSPRG